MTNIQLTKKEARQFLLLKHGLLGDYRFIGKSGALSFIRQAGCIQFDPIDVCGKNAELVLQSRVKGFTKDMLYELLYIDRSLVDYFDKNLAIFPVEDWKYFERERQQHLRRERSHEEIMQAHDSILNAIATRGPLCSADLDMDEKVNWYWSATTLSRATLEHMYFCGELAVHHKKGTIKYYDLIQNCISPDILAEPDPYPADYDHQKWRVLRRISSVGLLWNRASDAWLGIPGLKAAGRGNIFDDLLAASKIIPITVQDVKDPLYCHIDDLPLIQTIRENPPAKKRCEFIAPLDNLMWDRKLIKALFDFDYKWEIYTPQAQRKYGYYVLPILYGDRLIGRIEAIYDKKVKKLNVPHIWYEPDVKMTKALENALESAIKRFERFNKA